jgi:hypothetical protein
MENNSMNYPLLAAICGSLLALPMCGRADSSFTITTTTADAFLAAGSPNNPFGTDLSSTNFGKAGTLALAPASSTKGEFDSVIMFNTAGAVSQFNATYGAGNWQLTGLSLRLLSNFGVQGEQPTSRLFNTINQGSFGIDWLGYDGWVEGTGGGNGGTGYPNNSSVSFKSISTLFSAGSASLGTYTYTPPGDNTPTSYVLALNGSLVGDAAAGGNVSLYFYAADSQVSYLFGSKDGGTSPQLTLTAAPVPEPGTLTLTTMSLAGLLVSRRLWRGKPTGRALVPKLTARLFLSPSPPQEERAGERRPL